jgi:hypothetical protein
MIEKQRGDMHYFTVVMSIAWTEVGFDARPLLPD